MKSAFFLALAIMASAAQAQLLIPTLVDHKFGFRNETGTMVISPKYELVFPFYKNVAYTFENGLQTMGAIDRKGNEILPIIYDNIITIDDGYLIVRKDDKYGVFDVSGKLLIPIEYTDIEYEKPNYFIIKNEKNWMGVMNGEGKTIIPFDYLYIEVLGDCLKASKDARLAEGYAIFDKNGKKINLLPCENIEQDKQPHLYRLTSGKGKDKKIALFNSKKGELYDGGYVYVEDISCGLILVAKEDANQNLIYSYIDENGKTVIPASFSYASTFSDGVAWVENKTEKSYKYIDTTGKDACSFKDAYSYWRVPFTNGRSIVSLTKENLVVIDKKGATIGKIELEGASLKKIIPTNAAFILYTDKGYGVIDREGKWTIKPKFEEMGIISDTLFWVLDNQKYSIVNRYGTPIIDLKFDDISEEKWQFTESIWLVKKDGKTGIVNKNGVLVLAPEYHYISNKMLHADGWLLADCDKDYKLSALVNYKTGKKYECIKTGMLSKMIDDNSFFFTNEEGHLCCWQLDTGIKFCDR